MIRPATLVFALAALPAWADPCADVTDPEAIAREDAVAADTAADPGRYRELGAYWSPDFGFDGMVVIQGPNGGETAAKVLQRVLPQVDAALGLTEAGRQIAAGGAAPTVTIRLLDGPPGTPDEAWTWCEGRVCTVELFPDFWQRAGAEQLAFTLAHELFHAAQQLAYPAVDHCNSYWWVEGTAEWFANLALPRSDFTARAGFLAEWDTGSAGTRLIDTDYEAVAFWFWAGERFGPVLPLTLGEFGNTGLNRVQTVAGLLSPDDWADFATVYLMGGLAFPDGRPALPAPDLGPVIPEGQEEVLIEGPDLSLPRARLTLGAGLWRIAVESASPGSVVLVGNESGGAFERVEPGGSVTRFFTCGSGGPVVVALAGGTLSGTRARLRVTQDDRACEACIHGTWEMTTPRDPTNDGFDEALRADILAHEGVTMEVIHDHDGPRLTLMPDGRYRWEDPKTQRAFGSGADGAMEVLTRLVTNEETGRHEDREGIQIFRKEAALSAGTTGFVAGPLSGHEVFKEARALVPLLPQPYRLVSCTGSQMVWERMVDPDVETTRIFRRVD